MVLQLETIKQITFGALRIEQQEGYFRFFRFTPGQEKILEERGFSPRQYATAGIRLDFYCHSGVVSFDFKAFPGSGREYYAIDGLIDGVNTVHYYREKNRDEGHFVLPVPERNGQPVRVTVYFPNVSGIAVKNLTVPEGGIGPAEKRRKLLALGDSITQGYDARHPQLSYGNLLADALQTVMVNQGIGGDVFCERNIEALPGFLPEIVTVAYGTNDWARGETDVFARAGRYFKKLRELYPAASVFAVLPIWRAGEEKEKAGGTLARVREDIRTAAEGNGAAAIETASFMPQTPDYYYDGGLHPNDLGFLFYGRALAKEIKKRRPDLFDITDRA